MDIAAKLDDIGKPAWIAVTILGFIFFWPVGLAILAYLFWSRRMKCWKHEGWSDMRRARGRWHNQWKDFGQDGFGWHRSGSSGNAAFDEYRNETLKRLEEEQKEFFEFLERLRQAKDKSEFDQFMSERRGRQQGGDSSAQPQT